MFIPDRYRPTRVSRDVHFDSEGRLRSFRYGRSDEGGVGESNSLYATESEYFGAITPFLKVARHNDAKRRNYVIQPGGAVIQFASDIPEKPRAVFPRNSLSFGHGTLDTQKVR